MQKSEFDKKLADGEVEIQKETGLPPEVLAVLAKNQNDEKNNTENYIALLEGLRKVKPFRTSAPTNVPRNFIDAIEFYDTGGVRRVYFYINKTWRYVTLT